MDPSPIELPIQRGKIGRAILACTACRASKVKCTRESPSCHRCSSRGITCSYLPSRPKRKARLDDRLKAIETSLSDLPKSISAQTEYIQPLECVTTSFQIHRTNGGWSRSSTLNEERVHKLVGGYVKHFHSMHPFINRLEIERLLKELPMLPTWPRINTALVCLMMALGEVHERPSPDQLYHRTTLPSSDGEFFPGRIYFDHATAALQGDTIQHVQGKLLAAIYLAQLRRLQDSYEYLFTAAQRIQACLGPMTRDREQDPALVLAFWTCLQLESEFLPCAFPRSGLSRYEWFVPLPSLQEGDDIEVLDHLINHIAWRKSMSQVLAQEIYPIQKVQDQLLKVVGHPGSTPSENILQARLRATCYDTLAAVYRPLLWEILNGSEKLPEGAIENFLQEGIKALLHSITAFHDVIGQLVFTNVCMTAHMKSQNMMVILMIYQSSTYGMKLAKLISREDLRALLLDTLSFIDLAESPEVAPDFKALREVVRKLDLFSHTGPDTPVSL
ncbi:hypothetical protein DL98DRAFT_662438 [Cadophora sp. DSE1049]|nr:hypothetical protein DL98DRAFT_662438 [Cadophora sp. DSE1049]